MLRLTPRVAAGIFFALQGVCFSSWGSRIASLQEDLQLSEGMLGLILLALPFGLISVTPIAGVWVAHFGSRRLLPYATLAHALSLSGVAITQNAWQLAIVLAVFGASSTVMNTAVNAQGIAVEADLRCSIMASFHGIWSLAGFVGASLGGLLIAAHVSCLAHYGLVVLLVMAGVAWAAPQLLPDDVQARHTGRRARRMPDGELLQLGFVALCAMVCEGTMFDWSGVYFHKVVHAPQRFNGLGYAAYMGAMAMGRFMVDRFVGQYGWVAIVRFCGALITLGLTLSAAWPALPVATLGFMMVGAGTSAIVPLVYGQAGKSKALSPGLALSAVSTVGFLGFLLGPPIIGFLAQLSGLRVAFACIAAFGLALRWVVQRLAQARSPSAALAPTEAPGPAFTAPERAPGA